MSSSARRRGPSGASSLPYARTWWPAPRLRPEHRTGPGRAWPGICLRVALGHTGSAVMMPPRTRGQNHVAAGSRVSPVPREAPPDRSRLPLLPGQESYMIILGIILLIIGFIAKIAILWTIGIVILAIGLILLLLGAIGHSVGPRRHYW